MRRAGAALLALGLVGGACSGPKLTVAAPLPTDSPSPSPGAGPRVSPSASPDGSSQAAPSFSPLCHQAAPSPSPAPTSAGRLPPAVAAVADQVAGIRGLRFRSPVSPKAVTKDEMGSLVQGSLNQQFPIGPEERRGRAWSTIGVIPAGTDLHRAFLDLGTSQIVGFYDEITKRLVFVGDGTLSPFARFTLSHELTHALDDQHFDLSRLDRLSATCRDDRTEAFLSLAEGDAVQTSLAWGVRNLSPAELLSLQREGGSFPPPPASVPPFVLDLFAFPYPNGQAFVAALLARGGQAAVDAALRDPPISTEQILHPARFRSDLPQDVEVPDLRIALGTGWRRLDVQDAGEAWLLLMLQLRLPHAAAARDAAGWDGGQYRAWTDGVQTAVELQTVWDTDRDAREFAAGMTSWLGSQMALVRPQGGLVTVLFASDRPTLDRLEAAVRPP